MNVEVTLSPDWPESGIAGVGGRSGAAVSASVAMDTGNPWEDSSSSDDGNAISFQVKSTADVAGAEGGGGGQEESGAPPTSSTPPEDGWANFGDFEGSAAAKTDGKPASSSAGAAAAATAAAATTAAAAAATNSAAGEMSTTVVSSKCNLH